MAARRANFHISGIKLRNVYRARARDINRDCKMKGGGEALCEKSLKYQFMYSTLNIHVFNIHLSEQLIENKKKELKATFRYSISGLLAHVTGIKIDPIRDT